MHDSDAIPSSLNSCDNERGDSASLRAHRLVNPHLPPQRPNDLLNALHFRRRVIGRLVTLDLLLFQPKPLGDLLPGQAGGSAAQFREVMLELFGVGIGIASWRSLWLMACSSTAPPASPSTAR